MKSGIADAVRTFGRDPGDRKAVAEVIANNVRVRIMKEHLNDPAYFSSMSKLLDGILADSRAKRLDYEQYLANIADLARKVQAGQGADTPEPIRTPDMCYLPQSDACGEEAEAHETDAAYRADRERALELALKIDEAVKLVRSDDWRGHQARENEIKRALLQLLDGDESEVERIFPIIKRQTEY